MSELKSFSLLVETMPLLRLNERRIIKRLQDKKGIGRILKGSVVSALNRSYGMQWRPSLLFKSPFSPSSAVPPLTTARLQRSDTDIRVFWPGRGVVENFAFRPAFI